MTGGIIANNIASWGGGGVWVWYESFVMSNGKISNNTASVGGGVYVSTGSFSMSGGVIANNTNRDTLVNGVAFSAGGGVFVSDGSFNMSSGVIAHNTAIHGGGVNVDTGSFIMSGGTISDNKATKCGGGVNVYHAGSFSLLGGAITVNRATDGGGVYLFRSDIDGSYGFFNMSGGVISDNTAFNNGGGIGVENLAGLEHIYVSNGAVFSNNRASAAYNRNPAHNNLYNKYIMGNVVWSSPFTQGYNNYDISYTSGTLFTNTDKNDQDNSGGNSDSNSNDEGLSGSNDDGNDSSSNSDKRPSILWDEQTKFLLVIVALGLVAGVSAIVLFVYFQKEET
ncbi:MAG: hypothetical protein LBH74_01235 [Nitrososphaerota archaeon]|jgi:hypothetical protein|nr:hypothetical protein [Nitrososphaerota archaeon]